MKNKTMYITTVIDTELWNEANWLGMAVLSDKQSAPYLGFVFQNKDSAIEIFKQWNESYGSKDIYEEIRISIIEGDIPEQDKGYTVHVTTHQDNLIGKCKKLNLPLSTLLFVIISRFNRIPSEKGNRNIRTFREEYERFLSYKIIPIHMTDEGLEPLFDYEIEKTEIYFKNVEEIQEDDVDFACIKQNVK